MDLGIIERFFYLPYTFSVIGATYLILKYILGDNTPEIVRVLINISMGIFLGWLFKCCLRPDVELDVLVSSFFASVTLYHWIVKQIMKLTGDTYKQESVITKIQRYANTKSNSE
jgi:hypothetical protein